jgi:lipoprotein-anchoring transpeptidase ErfK/SrfK
VLFVWAGSQSVDWCVRTDRVGSSSYDLKRRFIASTSRFGLGQAEGSNRTPLGLHRVAVKAGAGWPVGTVFRGRQPVGFTWQGMPAARIAHRILWLEGLEPGFNQGLGVDSFQRFIYIHGLADELTLGRPESCGCIHLSAADLMPLFEQLPLGTLVWISANPAPAWRPRELTH